MDDPTRRPVCYCGLVTEIKTSWTTGNPGRRFFGCKNHASLRHHPPYIHNRRRLALACRMLAWWRLALACRMLVRRRLAHPCRMLAWRLLVD
ncbi:hypothetical protein V6N12_026635 [Hibiscus sabdariffa]|uniref:Zinc finger GRF-type domain-containing protein n=1 Tax=Hibiscus sabdariffa TaxID=183260 RepID=A0ABR2DSC6_9ROSI